jgi:hypothetical protein
MSDSLTHEELAKTCDWLNTFWRLKDDPLPKIAFTITGEDNYANSSDEPSVAKN